jgi:pantoate--beta-alanine ligase
MPALQRFSCAAVRDYAKRFNSACTPLLPTIACSLSTAAGAARSASVKTAVVTDAAGRVADFTSIDAAVKALSEHVRSSISTPPPIICRSPQQMRLVRSAMDVLSFRAHQRAATVGFVPTMGALHAGHLSLLSSARLSPPSTTSGTVPRPQHADFLVSSIFVNPTQFAPTEDLASYPRTFDSDLKKLRENHTSVVFAPTAASMYPHPTFAQVAEDALPAFRTFVDILGVDAASPEGSARPGFFRGVATVVTKLFSCVQPTHAVFGQKDGIQCIVVRTLVRDLNLPLQIIVAETTREADGLAMSSRNIYLSKEQRKVAPALYQALQHVKGVIETSPEGQRVREQALERAVQRGTHVGLPGAIDDGAAEKAAQAAAQRSRAASSPSATKPAPLVLEPWLQKAITEATHIITSAGHTNGVGPEERFGEVQYLTFSDAATGQPISNLLHSSARDGAVMLSVAARIVKTRLLDNIMVLGGLEDLGNYN